MRKQDNTLVDNDRFSDVWISPFLIVVPDLIGGKIYSIWFDCVKTEFIVDQLTGTGLLPFFRFVQHSTPRLSRSVRAVLGVISEGHQAMHLLYCDVETFVLLVKFCSLGQRVCTSD